MAAGWRSGDVAIVHLRKSGARARARESHATPAELVAAGPARVVKLCQVCAMLRPSAHPALCSTDLSEEG